MSVVSKFAYFLAAKKLAAVFFAAGKQTVDIPLLEDSTDAVIEEFEFEFGQGYTFTVLHRGLIRIRKD